MASTVTIKNRIRALKEEYDSLRVGKNALLNMIDEAELPESVYNSNAIENSTLTLRESKTPHVRRQDERCQLPRFHPPSRFGAVHSFGGCRPRSRAALTGGPGPVRRPLAGGACLDVDRRAPSQGPALS